MTIIGFVFCFFFLLKTTIILVGIGLEVVKLLSSRKNVETILTSRDAKIGQDLVKSLKAEGMLNVTFHQLDLADPASVDSLARFVGSTGGLDVLVNNGAVAFKGSTFGADEAKTTLATNLLGTANLTYKLIPHMRNRPGAGARIINVASRAGKLGQLSSELQAKFRADDLTYEGLVALTDQFVEDVRLAQHRESGWSNSMYGVSKLALIAFSNLLGREVAKDNIAVSSMCPGYCRTDMSGGKGHKSAEEGADTIIWLALQERPVRNGFYGERRMLDWTDPVWE